MASDAERAAQRAAWRKALASHAAVKRNARFRRGATPVRAGMIRKTVGVDASTDEPGTARCTTRGCPVVFRTGPPRACGWCQADDPGGEWAQRFAELTAAPGDRVTDKETGERKPS